MSYYAPDWKGTKWIVFDAGMCSLLAPAEPGCYVVYIDGKIAYIGQSINVRKRFSMHGFNFAHYSNDYDTPWGQFDSVVIKVRFGDRYGDWAMRELRLIKRIKPHLNCVGSIRKRKNG